MTIIEIIIISFVLSIDAFVASICKGMKDNKVNIKKCIIIPIYFSLFQAIMPLLGYILGNSFYSFISNIDHYIAFILLLLIGISMIKNKSDDDIDDKIDFKSMIILSIATSIDAFSIGITLAFIKTNIYITMLFIFIITFIMCFIGVIIGTKFKNKFGNKCEIIGGITLILIGIKILIEHLT